MNEVRKHTENEINPGHRAVTATSLNVRSLPSTEKNTVVGKLHAGDIVKVLSDEGEWLLIENPFDTSSAPVYIHGSYTLELNESGDIKDEDGFTVGERTMYIKKDTPKPSDLEGILGVNSGGRKIRFLLRRKAITSFIKDLKEKAVEEGIILHLGSGWRSFDSQKELMASNRGRYAEIPGFSEHHLGTTIDFTEVVRDSEAFLWLLENGFKAGWVPSQYFTPTTGIKEPWHWRYVGEKAAKEYHDKYEVKIIYEIVRLKVLKDYDGLKKNKNLLKPAIDQKNC